MRSPSPYSIAEGDSTERVRVLVLEGELDLAAAPRLQRAARRDRFGARAGARPLARDFIDSAVLKELLRARAELAERDVQLVLAGVPPPVRRLLDLTRTSELFEDAPDVAEAVRRLG